jgi:hypothetical protein
MELTTENVAFVALIICTVVPLVYLVHTMWDARKKTKVATIKYEQHTEQVWKEYMGVRFPLLKYELGMWNGMSPESKRAWIKQLKAEIKSGKKIPIKDDKGVVIGYETKDRKGIAREKQIETIVKKVHGL